MRERGGLVGAVAPWVLALALALAACGGGSSALPGAAAPAAALKPGDLALDYVAAAEYDALLVEVDFVEGLMPSDAALARLEEVLRQRLDKDPERVQVVLDTVIPRERALPSYDVAALQALARSYRQHWSGRGPEPRRAAMWIVYVPGLSARDAEGMHALGAAFGASEVAVFGEALELLTGPASREAVECAVLLHEVGHLLGLVNNGLPMVELHEDPVHARHDAWRGCVMYHRVDAAWLQAPPPLPAVDYCYRCRLDLFAAGGPEPGEPPPAGSLAP
ncbi:MAG: hypothetical protein KatS3mg102_1287 [Planctomycetota bacterium]|nr:MAG: hypothetical protein KatS3mg102_1287 [Planctomycetota bacterium]